MPPHILFVSTSNLATNPRLVKEIELALEKGYRVTALVCSFHNWSYALNEAVKKKLAEKIQLVEAVADRSAFPVWVLSTLLQKFQLLKLKLGVSNPSVLSDVLIKRSILLRWKLGQLKGNYQLVIAHNPGAFEPAAVFAKKHRTPLGIDVEDYHPGEATNPAESNRMKRLLQQVLPQANYVSAAAPLILEKVQKDCSNELRNAFTILNYFNKAEFVAPLSAKDKPLQCVWFSQNIDQGRGLEPLLALLKSFGEEVQLHLYGNANPLFYESHLAGNPQVILHPPVPQQQLHQLLALYDVGIALEDLTSNLNRTICLTNKLLAYYQAGLYILATDTAAQQQFLEQHPSHGIITSLSNLQEGLQQLVQQKETIRAGSQTRYTTAAKHHAAAELQQLAHCWEQLIKESCKS
ncbi:hypothetical protein PDL71_03835 [Lacibacter sp. MH-610]|uniref:hypothetical protein n=1 Tax=Lacibacter sp. MH-610 TaxID=3020883 RepID=UPI003891A91C